MKVFAETRFAGHESFVVRIGWLRKMYDLANDHPEALATDEGAITRLGIGRNMVKSLEFWSDACSVTQKSGCGITVGPLGRYLFNKTGGVDQYMETLDSVALVHWAFSTHANIAAWDVVFGERSMNRFTRRQLIERLASRATQLKKSLSASTLEQHAAIFLASYSQRVAKDFQDSDAIACPLWDLELIRRAQGFGQEELFEIRTQERLPMRPEIFGKILASYWLQNFDGAESIGFDSILNGAKSPGAAFRLSTYALERGLINLEKTPDGIFRLLDTPETRRVAVISQVKLRKLAAL